MRQPDLKQGMRIQVEMHSNAANQQYLSRIETLGREFISIQFPTPINGKEMNIQRGMKCCVAFSTAEGAYAFDAQVVEIGCGSSSLVTLPRPKTFRSSKRRHVRFDTSVWVRYAVTPREEMGNRIDQSLRSYAETLNLSGGGFFFQPKEKLSIGAILEIEVDLPTEADAALAIGRVVHISKKGYGIEFLLIDDTDRDRLIRYIFAKERASRRTTRNTNS